MKLKPAQMTNGRNTKRVGGKRLYPFTLQPDSVEL